MHISVAIYILNDSIFIKKKMLHFNLKTFITSWNTQQNKNILQDFSLAIIQSKHNPIYNPFN